jgi:hypothetical protein
LVSAREHPPAAGVRRQQRDLATIVRVASDLNDRQSRLFFLILTALARYEMPDLSPLIDDDVAEALAALGATYETSARGVIYEHQPIATSAQRLMNALKPALAAWGRGAAGFEREAAVVLRRLEAAARETKTDGAGRGRAFVDLVGRVVRQMGEANHDDNDRADAPRVIIP